jgi:hypothetical protein
MVAKSRARSSPSVSYPRLAYSAPTLDPETVRDIFRLTRPATKALPFVRLRTDDQPLTRPERYWCVQPTGNSKKDLELGRRYARLAIAAMKADDDPHLIAEIVQDIVRDGIERAVKGTRRNPVARGFLIEISETLAATS